MMIRKTPSLASKGGARAGVVARPPQSQQRANRCSEDPKNPRRTLLLPLSLSPLIRARSHFASIEQYRIVHKPSAPPKRTPRLRLIEARAKQNRLPLFRGVVFPPLLSRAHKSARVALFFPRAPPSLRLSGCTQPSSMQYRRQRARKHREPARTAKNTFKKRGRVKREREERPGARVS